MEKVLKIIKERGEIRVEDQQDLEADYGFTWDEFNDFDEKFGNDSAIVSDSEVAPGIEEVVAEAIYGGVKIRSTTLYGQGSISHYEAIYA